MSHRVPTAAHNKRALKGATMAEIAWRRRRRRANEHVRQLVRDLQAAVVLRAYVR